MDKMLDSQTMYLYLVDEVTGDPIVQAPCPTKITKQGQKAKKLLPYMKFGLKAME